MIPLPTTQRMLRLLSICPATSKGNRIICIAFSVFLFMSNMCALIASTKYFLDYISIDLEEALYAAFQMAAFYGLLYTIIVALMFRKKIVGFLSTLSKICEASKN